jgi:hypothetical protein
MRPGGWTTRRWKMSPRAESVMGKPREIPSLSPLSAQCSPAGGAPFSSAGACDMSGHPAHILPLSHAQSPPAHSVPARRREEAGSGFGVGKLGLKRITLAGSIVIITNTICGPGAKFPSHTPFSHQMPRNRKSETQAVNPGCLRVARYTPCLDSLLGTHHVLTLYLVHTMFGLSTWYTPCLDSVLLARDAPSLAEHHQFFAPPLRLPSPTPGPRLTLPTPSRHGCATAGLSTGWLGDTYPYFCPHLHILLSLRDLSLRHHGQNTWEFPLRATYRIRQHL